MDRIGLTKRQRFWLSHVEACEASGVSMKAYAEKHRLSLASFYCWKGQLKKRGLLGEGRSRSSPVSLVPVVVEPRSDVGPEPVSGVTRIALASGIVIEAPQSVDADTLCDLLHAAMAAVRSSP